MILDVETLDAVSLNVQVFSGYIPDKKSFIKLQRMIPSDSSSQYCRLHAFFNTMTRIQHFGHDNYFSNKRKFHCFPTFFSS